jgi:hypothetical protein
MVKKVLKKMQSELEGASAGCQATVDKNYSRIGFFLMKI